ncbi:MAG: DUF4920 domain-containing protein [Acidobacteria bacterium]|nr:DUF4920 domain-containing protein [Acidobacteriota bacterium]
MLLVMCLFLAGDVIGREPAADGTQVTISAFESSSPELLGKVIQVTGKVIDVCPAKGCWMVLADGDHQVKVKVKDGEMVFGKELIGKKVLAEGTVYSFEMTLEDARAYYAHLAEEKGEVFNPESITKGETVYQIGGIGAKVL